MKSKRQPTAARRRKSAARLAAVQVLYGIEVGGVAPDSALRDVLDHGLTATAPQTVADDEREVDQPLVEPDSELFTAVVRGVLARRDDLDRMVGGALSRDWSVERLEEVLRAILRAGAFELACRPETPPRVAISEYVDIAHAFYSGSEPGLVNAVLDRIARVVRAEEFEGDGGRG